MERVAQQPVKDNIKPQVCIIELGGTVGDIEGMPFVESFRQFQFRVKVCSLPITVIMKVHQSVISVCLLA